MYIQVFFGGESSTPAGSEWVLHQRNGDETTVILQTIVQVQLLPTVITSRGNHGVLENVQIETGISQGREHGNWCVCVWERESLAGLRAVIAVTACVYVPLVSAFQDIYLLHIALCSAKQTKNPEALRGREIHSIIHLSHSMTHDNQRCAPANVLYCILHSKNVYFCPGPSPGPKS